MILCFRALVHDVAGVLGVGADLEPVLAQVTLAPEPEDGRRVVVAYFLFFGVVSDALADVAVAVSAAKGNGERVQVRSQPRFTRGEERACGTGSRTDDRARCSPPDVEWQLEAND